MVEKTTIDKTLGLDDLTGRTLEDILREVVQRQESFTVRLPEGDIVNIKPSPPLRPLPELDGFIPEGWKNAIYD
jgi:hypothetical protein